MVDHDEGREMRMRGEEVCTSAVTASLINGVLRVRRDFVEDQSKIVTVGDLYEAVGNLLGRAP